jgi:8-hydroxy-5-deazaflavin:NADPH oxidoreductase
VRIAVVGSGGVGLGLAPALAAVGHDVVLATRDPAATTAREDVAGWVAANPDVPVVALQDAAAGADLVVNATGGLVSADALEAVDAGGGGGALDGVVVLDLANPLDFSGGFPPRVLADDRESLAERLQRRFPAARFVKSLNTVGVEVMVDPGAVAGGDHTAFLSGDDADAKAVVLGLLHDLGWRDVMDLGDLTTARAVELWLPLWLRLHQATGSRTVTLKVVR